MEDIPPETEWGVRVDTMTFCALELRIEALCKDPQTREAWHRLSSMWWIRHWRHVPWWRLVVWAKSDDPLATDP